MPFRSITAIRKSVTSIRKAYIYIYPFLIGAVTLGMLPVTAVTSAWAKPAVPVTDTQQPAAYEVSKQPALSPQPVKVDYQSQAKDFVFTADTCVTAAPEAQAAVQILRSALEPSQGIKLPNGNNCAVSIAMVNQISVNGQQSEAYKLDANQSGVRIVATSPRGAIWGVQTLLQLIGPWVHSSVQMARPAVVPAVHIVDAPRYSWRGMLVSTAGEFIPVYQLKRLINQFSVAKLNVLHFHFTDDEAWRIALTSVSGSKLRLENLTKHNKPGQSYSREQFIDLVKYAAEHGVSLLPEIDGPAHSSAILRALPQLNTDKTSLKQGAGGPAQGNASSFDPKNAETYKFVDSAIKQIESMISEGISKSKVPDAALPYMHLGGDEAVRTSTADYGRYMKKVSAIALHHKLTPIYWNEALRSVSELPDGAVVQRWIGGTDKQTNQKLAKTRKFKFIYSIAKNLYLSQVPDKSIYGPSWACRIQGCNLNMFYDYDPSKSLGLEDKHVLGVEAALWTSAQAKLLLGDAGIEYLTFPRLLATAEAGWVTADNKNYDRFAKKVPSLAVALTLSDISFYLSRKLNWWGSAQGTAVPDRARGNRALVGLVVRPGVSNLHDFPRSGVLRDASGKQFKVAIDYEMSRKYVHQLPGTRNGRQMNSVIKVYVTIPTSAKPGITTLNGSTNLPAQEFVNPGAVAFKFTIGDVDRARLLDGVPKLKTAYAPKSSHKVFSDIAPNSLFAAEIHWAKQSGLTHGWPDGTFRPWLNTNRDAMAAFIYRLAGSPQVDISKPSPFKDVKPGNMFYREILWMHSTGITTGWPDGTYRPNEKVSREAMAAFLHRLTRNQDFKTAYPKAKLQQLNIPEDLWAGFKDARNSQFARDIAWLQQAGITTGWPDGTFRPYDPIQRAAIIAFIYRLVSNQ